jgi:cell division ATPase FtsA
LQKLVEKNIIEMEKSIDEFVKDIYLIIETPQTMSIQLSVIKNNEGKNITKQDALYLIQDAKQQILKSHLDIRILHIIVENYVSDDVEYKFLPLEKNSKKFSIDLKFICFPKNLLKNFEQLFLKQQIFINQFICLNYVKMFDSKDKDNEKNICELAKDIVKGVNKQEVVSIPKIIKKTGFFEKLFHLFR